MPVGFNSPARNLFLLGSSGAQVVTNFFKTINQSAGTDGVYSPDEIKYDATDQKFVLAGSALNSNSKSFGFFEKRDSSGNKDWDVIVESPAELVTLRAMELDSNNNLIVVGRVGATPWIGKYSNGGVIDWQSTSNSADVVYLDVTSDSNGNYYACGRTPLTASDTQAFVEKFDGNGSPGWGKQAFMLGRDVILGAIDNNDRGEVVAVGSLEDDSSAKGYIVKIDTNTGEILWDRTLTSPDGYDGVACRDVFIDTNDQIYVVGNIGYDLDSVVGYIIKYSPEGNIIWQKQIPKSSDNLYFSKVHSDGETEQTVVFGRYYESNGNESGLLSKYSKNGDLVWRRTISSSRDSGQEFGSPHLDGDPSFYYLFFRDQAIDGLAGTPDTYTYGKVSTSGNGLGDFEYFPDGSTTIDYTILAVDDVLGRLSDGSVRNDSSDLISYPFTANKLVFDDLATHVSNKKRQMDNAGDFEYSGSPAVRPADFQQLNLLGDVYSGSGDWLDQSGKGNNAQTTFTTTTTTNIPGTTFSENFASTTSSYSTYGTVVEDVVTNDLPFTATHYSGKVRDLQTGGFRIDLTGNSNGSDFFMGCWIKFDTYATSRQMGIDLFGGYVYWETLANGAIAVRHDGGARADSGNTSLNDGNWHHIALSRTGGTLYGFLDGTAVVSTNNGVSGASVNANENFWFFGGSGTAYNTDAKVLDPFVYVGAGTSGYTVPTAPLIDSDGNINHFSGFSGNEEYISPAISISGGTTETTTTNTVAHNPAGYFEFDGTDDYIELKDDQYGGLTMTDNDWTYETWLWTDVQSNSNHVWNLNGRTFKFDVVSSQQVMVYNSIHVGTQSFGQLPNNTWGHFVITKTGATEVTIKGYLNGVEVWTVDDSAVSAVEHWHNFSGARIGTSNTLNNWDGRMGDIRIYRRALTAAAVFQNYNATRYKYDGIAPNTSPRIGPGIAYDDLLLNYDFSNEYSLERLGTIQG
tara:strand:+ start:1464 stop:4370 length:2907 start_codon:yes stop_codon:yes gene_type:complete